MTAVTQTLSVRPTSRIDSIDFWRGVVLCTIFINHIPGNLFEILTQKNVGFSDSAEAFVFLSGLSLALAYGPRIAGRQAGQAVSAIARRAVRIYGVHIILSLAGIGVFAAAAMATGDGDLLQIHGRDLFVDDPAAALVGLLSLGHQLGYFNILPLYVVLLAPTAALLRIGSRRVWMMLVVSVATYLAARVSNLNVPTWPMKGSWFFDPFAWQLMMAMGIGAGLGLKRGRLPRPAWLVGAAVMVVALGAASVTDGFGLLPGLRDWTATWADLDKTMLGAGRVVHFAALAYLVAVFDVAGLVRRTFAFAPLCRLGRHSLWVFALLSLLAALGQVLTQAFGHPVLLDGVIVGGGLAALYFAATLLETRRNAARLSEAAA